MLFEGDDDPVITHITVSTKALWRTCMSRRTYRCSFGEINANIFEGKAIRKFRLG